MIAPVRKRALMRAVIAFAKEILLRTAASSDSTAQRVCWTQDRARHSVEPTAAMSDGLLEYYWVLFNDGARPLALKKKGVLNYLALEETARGVGGSIDMLPPVQLDPESPSSREERYQYHERWMIHHTEQCLALRPGAELPAVGATPLLAVSSDEEDAFARAYLRSFAESLR